MDNQVNMRQQSNSRFGRIIVILTLCAFSVSCASYTYIPHTRASSIKKYVKPGDPLVITTKEKDSVVLTVKQIQSDRLVSSSQQVLIRDINVIKKKQFNRRKSAFAAGVAISVVVAAIVAKALLNAILGG